MVLKAEILIITCFALHYQRSFTLTNLKEYIKSGIKAGIHIEPCSDQLIYIKDKLYAMLALKYIIINDYTKDIFKAFSEAEQLGLISVEKEDLVFGEGLLPATVVRWVAN